MAEEQLPHKLQLNERRQLTMTGVTEVVSFEDSAVVLQTSLGTLIVQGRELQLKTLSLEGGQVAVDGTISSLVYEESRSGGGWRHRLFGWPRRLPAAVCCAAVCWAGRWGCTMDSFGPCADGIRDWRTGCFCWGPSGFGSIRALGSAEGICGWDIFLGFWPEDSSGNAPPGGFCARFFPDFGKAWQRQGSSRSCL